MNKNADIANLVVNEQLNRMLEQERKRLELLPMPELELELGQELPSFIKDAMLETALYTGVMMKISILARLN